MKNIVILILAFTAQVICLSAQENNRTAENNFTGSEYKIADVIKKCDLIIVGKFLNLGVPSVDASGETYYANASMQVTEVLKGEASGVIKVRFTAQVIPVEKRQNTPQLGSEYLLLIQTLNPGDLRVIKLMPATPEAKQHVKDANMRQS